MTDAIARTIPEFSGRANRIRCFAHILNLVVKAILSQFARTRRTSKALQEQSEDAAELAALEDDEEEEDAEQDGDEELDDEEAEQAAFDNVLVAEMDEELEEEAELNPGTTKVPLRTREDTKAGCFAISKVRVVLFLFL